VLIIICGFESGSTARVAKAIAEELHAGVVSTEQAPAENPGRLRARGIRIGHFRREAPHRSPRARGRAADGPGAKVFLFSACGIPRASRAPRYWRTTAAGTTRASRKCSLPKAAKSSASSELGFNNNSFLKLFGGINKDVRTRNDLGSATSFAKGLERAASPDGGGNR